MLTIGDARLTMLNGGNFRLDGGAMHGVVPKTLWSKLVSCDAHNRCEYTTRCLLIEVGNRRILVETGNGDKFPAKLKDIYGIDHDRSIGDAWLVTKGLAKGDRVIVEGLQKVRPGAPVTVVAPKSMAQAGSGSNPSIAPTGSGSGSAK